MPNKLRFPASTDITPVRGLRASGRVTCFAAVDSGQPFGPVADIDVHWLAEFICDAARFRSTARAEDGTSLGNGQPSSGVGAAARQQHGYGWEPLPGARPLRPDHGGQFVVIGHPSRRVALVMAVAQIDRALHVVDQTAS